VLESIQGKLADADAVVATKAAELVPWLMDAFDDPGQRDLLGACIKLCREATVAAEIKEHLADAVGNVRSDDPHTVKDLAAVVNDLTAPEALRYKAVVALGESARSETPAGAVALGVVLAALNDPSAEVARVAAVNLEFLQRENWLDQSVLKSEIRQSLLNHWLATQSEAAFDALMAYRGRDDTYYLNILTALQQTDEPKIKVGLIQLEQAQSSDQP
jgi:hypothetical protein